MATVPTLTPAQIKQTLDLIVGGAQYQTAIKQATGLDDQGMTIGGSNTTLYSALNMQIAQSDTYKNYVPVKAGNLKPAMSGMGFLEFTPTGGTTSGNAAVPTAAGATAVQTSPAGPSAVLNAPPPVQVGEPAPTGTFGLQAGAVLSPEQRAAQLMNRLQMEQLQGGLNIQGLASSGRGDLLTELAGLRQDVPETPPRSRGGGGGPRGSFDGPAFDEAPPGPRPQNLPSFQPAGSPSPFEAAPEPGVQPDAFAELRKALQVEDERRSELRGARPDTGLQVEQQAQEARAAAGQFLRSPAMTGALEARDLGSPEDHFHQALLRANEDLVGKSPADLARSALQAYGAAQVLQAKIQARSEARTPQRQALEKRAQALYAQLARGESHRLDPQTGQSTAEAMSPEKRAMLEGQLRSTVQTLENITTGRAAQRDAAETQQLQKALQLRNQAAQRAFERFEDRQKVVTRMRSRAAAGAAKNKLRAQARRIAEEMGMEPGGVLQSGLQGWQAVQAALSPQEMETILSEMGRGRRVEDMLGRSGVFGAQGGQIAGGVA